MPVIIVVGMVGGVFTPTESASVAAVYALFVTLFVFRSLRWRALPKLFGETVVQFSQILFCLGGASIFGWLLAFYQVPDMVTDFILGFTRDKLVVMLLIVFVNVVLGTFMDALPAILIFVPIIHPLGGRSRHPSGASRRHRRHDAGVRPADAAARACAR